MEPWVGGRRVLAGGLQPGPEEAETGELQCRRGLPRSGDVVPESTGICIFSSKFRNFLLLPPSPLHSVPSCRTVGQCALLFKKKKKIYY